MIHRRLYRGGPLKIRKAKYIPMELAYGGLIDTAIAPPSLISFLNAHGDEKIEDITVGRTVINKTVQGLINKISLNSLNNVAKKLGHDRLFHLFMIVKTDAGQYLMEKNQTIKAGSGSLPQGAETVKVPVTKDLTIAQFFDNGLKRAGKDKFYEYDPFKANCQMWVSDMLNGSGLNAPSSFINQNADKIVQNLPWYSKATSTIAKLITDTGAVLDLFLQKLGIGSL